MGKESSGKNLQIEFEQRTGNVKTENLPVRESSFILYQIVIYDALMSKLAEWIR